MPASSSPERPSTTWGGLSTEDLRTQVFDALRKMEREDLQVSEQKFAAMFIGEFVRRSDNTTQALQHDLTWYKERHRD